MRILIYLTIGLLISLIYEVATKKKWSIDTTRIAVSMIGAVLGGLAIDMFYSGAMWSYLSYFTALTGAFIFLGSIKISKGSGI